MDYLLRKNMLVKICARKYVTLDGFINNTNEIFQDYTTLTFKSLLWIHFQNSQIGLNTRMENHHIYEKIPNLDKKWTLIKQKL